MIYSDTQIKNFIESIKKHFNSTIKKVDSNAIFRTNIEQEFVEIKSKICDVTYQVDLFDNSYKLKTSDSSKISKYDNNDKLLKMLFADLSTDYKFELE